MRKRGIDLSIFRLILFSFNKNDFAKQWTILDVSHIEYIFFNLINMHLMKNWLLQPAYLYHNPWWLGCGRFVRQATTLLTNHYDCVSVFHKTSNVLCFIKGSNDRGLDGHFIKNSHPFGTISLNSCNSLS